MTRSRFLDHDLADRSKRRVFLGTVSAYARNMLVLTEGVVPYLSVEEAASLADDLRQLGSVRYWVVDYFSPEATKYRRRKGMDRKMQNAPFRFEPGDWHGFFREHGWQAGEGRYLMEESERLGRPMPIPWPITVA